MDVNVKERLREEVSTVRHRTPRQELSVLTLCRVASRVLQAYAAKCYQLLADRQLVKKSASIRPCPRSLSLSGSVGSIPAPFGSNEYSICKSAVTRLLYL
jgi:hypothetical protein